MSVGPCIESFCALRYTYVVSGKKKLMSGTNILHMQQIKASKAVVVVASSCGKTTQRKAGSTCRLPSLRTDTSHGYAAHSTHASLCGQTTRKAGSTYVQVATLRIDTSHGYAAHSTHAPEQPPCECSGASKGNPDVDVAVLTVMVHLVDIRTQVRLVGVQYSPHGIDVCDVHNTKHVGHSPYTAGALDVGHPG